MAAENCGEELFLSGATSGALLAAVMEKGYRLKLTVRGTSMYPFIQDGDTVIVVPYKNRSPEIGDVAACMHPDSKQLIMHRIIRCQSTRFVIQGDNVASADGAYYRQHVLGRIAEAERNAKPIHFGFGPEKYFVAWMLRSGIYHQVMRPIYHWLKHGKLVLN